MVCVERQYYIRAVFPNLFGVTGSRGTLVEKHCIRAYSTGLTHSHHHKTLSLTHSLTHRDGIAKNKGEKKQHFHIIITKS